MFLFYLLLTLDVHAQLPNRELPILRLPDGQQIMVRMAEDKKLWVYNTATGAAISPLQDFREQAAGLQLSGTTVLNERPRDMVGRWEYKPHSNRDSVKVLKLWEDGRYQEYFRTVSTLSIRRVLIDTWGADSIRMDIVADSLALEDSKFDEFLRGEGQIFTLESVGTWGVEDDSLRAFPKRYDLSVNNLQKAEVGEFWSEVVPLVMPEDGEDWTGFVALFYTLLDLSYELNVLFESSNNLGAPSVGESNRTVLILTDAEGGEQWLTQTHWNPASADVNADLEVDFTDFVIFAQGFGQEIENLVFDERLDLDGDGSVALNDFLILAQQMGQ